MVITAHLHTILQRQTAEGMQRRLNVSLLSGSVAMDLIHDLGLELPVEAMLLVVNGRFALPDHILHEGDEVHLMPALSGG